MYAMLSGSCAEWFVRGVLVASGRWCGVLVTEDPEGPVNVRGWLV